MSKSSMTVRDVFELPEPGAEKPSDWKAFEDRVSTEVKGIKTAALPDLAEKVAELFEIPIPDIFVSSWKKADSIKALLEESRKAPETVMNTELDEHTINTQHRPSIEVRIQNKAVKKIEFTLKLVFNLKGFVLKIQDGLIRGMQPGLCDVKGKLEYQGLVIAEKKLAPITLPGSLSFLPVKTAEEKPSEQQASDSVASSPVVTPAVTASSQAAPPNEKVVETKIEREARVSSALAASEKIEPSKVEPAVAESANAPAPETVGARPPADRVGPSGMRVVEKIDDVNRAAAPVSTPTPTTTLEASSMPEPSQGIEDSPAVALNNPVEANKGSEVAASSEVNSEAKADEERTVWEVDDLDEDVASPQQASDNSTGEDAGTKASETPHDAIDRMSRELADRRAN